MHSKKLGVFIGRFQIFHHGHLANIIKALNDCERLLILVGSSFRAPNVKNPFSFEERLTLIKNNLKLLADKDQARVIIKPLEDNPYDEAGWVNEVKAQVYDCLLGNERPILIGHNKDESTYYLNHFKEWTPLEYPGVERINATALRTAFYEETLMADNPLKAWLPIPTRIFLEYFRKNNPEFRRLKEEHLFIKQYQNEWKGTPYPVLFVTTDTVLTCQQHVLLIQRGHCPGKHLWALPGGFLEINEGVEEGLFRELYEETQIDMAAYSLKKCLKGFQVFDRPDRSQIGRVITHSGWIDLPDQLFKQFPAINPADDAKAFCWVALDELDAYKTKLHDDHYFIIRAWQEKM